MRRALSRVTLAGTFGALLLTAVWPGAALAADQAGEGGWTRQFEGSLSAEDLGLPAGASPRRMARATLTGAAPKLGLPRSLRGVRVAGGQHVPAGPGGASALDIVRFQQSVRGLRVAWSQIDVTVSGGEVRSISSTVVPVGRRLAGKRSVSRKRALRVAHDAVKGPDDALRPLPVAYAGNPTTRKGKRRTPRRAWVVETMPDSALDDEAPVGLCIVVDAKSGRVLARWRGTAARDDAGDPGVASTRDATGTAAGSTPASMLQVFDAPSGKGYAQYRINGNPRVGANWPSVAEARLNLIPRTETMDRVTDNASNVARTICTVRNYCGKRGGFAGTNASIQPWQVNGNASATNAIRSTLTVNIDGTGFVPINGFNDIMAHEFGHVRDWVYAGDRQVSFTGREVEEGLADMFAYDYDRVDATLGEDALGGVRVDWADPGNVRYSGQPQPDHMDGYDETPPGKFTGQSPDEHFNSTILSHGYHLFVQRVGHTVAGNVVLNVPSALPPQPKFFHVKEAIFSRAGSLYPHDDPADSDTVPEVREAARQAFTEVGLPPLIVPPIPFPGTILD